MTRKYKHSKIWYLKQVNKLLGEISALGKDQGTAFLKKKKKAQKYLNIAKEIQANEQSHGRDT